MPSITDTLHKAWSFRHACKSFDPSFNISDADFATILEAARLSPSSFGFEPWSLIVLQNKTLREELRPMCWGAQGQLPTASHFVIMLARQPAAMAPDSAYIQGTIMHDTQDLPADMVTARAEKYRSFLQSDFAYQDNTRAKFEWAARQCYIALGNMLTTAALLGIDSCPMEGFEKEPVEAWLSSKGLLDRTAYGVICLAAFGKREKDPRPKTRRPMEAVVRWV